MMLKDNNIDPPLLNVGFGAITGEPFFGNSITATTPNSKKNANSISTTALNGAALNSPEGAKLIGRTPRSSHKIVTPLRKQSSSFLVASLESLFTDSQGISEQIAKITTLSNNSTNNQSSGEVKTPTVNSFASRCSVDSLSLSDPSLLQSYVQKSLESSAIGLESPFKRASPNNTLSSCPSSAMKNSLYNTPLKSKQSRSHDFSELPSQQRLKKRRSSILAQEEGEYLDSLCASDAEDRNLILSDLSHFKDNEADDLVSDIITIEAKNTGKITQELGYFEKMTADDNLGEFDCFNDSKATTTLSWTGKRTVSQNFNIPSAKEYQDGSKPPFSYASLIAQAIISSPKHKLALNNIYTWVMDTYPYYRLQSCGWQVN